MLIQHWFLRPLGTVLRQCIFLLIQGRVNKCLISLLAFLWVKYSVPVNFASKLSQRSTMRHTMKICDTVEIRITFQTRWSWVVWITLRPFYSWRTPPPYPSDRGPNGAHGWSERYVEERSLVQPGIEPRFLGLPSRRAVTSDSDIAAPFLSRYASELSDN
jgi:hypothetical protein